MFQGIFLQRSIGAPNATPLPVSAARSQHDALRGILLMCGGVSMFPFMNAAVKLLGADYPVAQIVWARFTGHLLVMLLVFLPQYGRRLLATRRPAVQIGRSLLMLVSNMMFVMAITRVPLATASAIGFTSPLIVTAMSVPILHESVGIRRWSALGILLFASLGLLGGAGHYLVIRAFQSGPAAVIAPLGYIELIGTTILGYAIFGNFPDLWTWIGAAIIIASGLYIAFRERLRSAVP